MGAAGRAADTRRVRRPVGGVVGRLFGEVDDSLSSPRGVGVAVGFFSGLALDGEVFVAEVVASHATPAGPPFGVSAADSASRRGVTAG